MEGWSEIIITTSNWSDYGAEVAGVKMHKVQVIPDRWNQEKYIVIIVSIVLFVEDVSHLREEATVISII